MPIEAKVNKLKFPNKRRGSCYGYVKIIKATKTVVFELWIDIAMLGWEYTRELSKDGTEN